MSPAPAQPARRGKRGWALRDWRSVRAWEGETRELLKKRHALWLHGWCIGLLILGAMWGASHLQMVLGLDSLAARYAITLGVGYLVFLAVLRAWAQMLVAPAVTAADAVEAVEVAADVALDVAGEIGAPTLRAGARAAGRVLESGAGGDFAGAGASADFGVVGDVTGDVAGEVAGGVFEAVGSADEGAVVVIPVLAVFALGCLVVLGAGSLLLLYFGAEVLLTVAIEVAFSYVTARTAVKVAREGWVTAALRLTWKPLLGALLCAVLLGAALDWLVPQARSLPHAFELIRVAR